MSLMIPVGEQEQQFLGEITFAENYDHCQTRCCCLRLVGQGSEEVKSVLDRLEKKP